MGTSFPPLWNKSESFLGISPVENEKVKDTKTSITVHYKCQSVSVVEMIIVVTLLTFTHSPPNSLFLPSLLLPQSSSPQPALRRNPPPSFPLVLGLPRATLSPNIESWILSVSSAKAKSWLCGVAFVLQFLRTVARLVLYVYVYIYFFREVEWKIAFVNPGYRKSKEGKEVCKDGLIYD